VHNFRGDHCFKWACVPGGSGRGSEVAEKQTLHCCSRQAGGRQGITEGKGSL